MPVSNSSTGKQFETVHTMTGYYDGPRSGIADYRGRPHIYESVYEDAPDGSDTFLLQPIDDETFRLALEDWAIWCRWERAFHSGQATLATHPALPNERTRHDELEVILKPRLEVARERAFRVKGRVDGHRRAEPGLTSSAELIVYWMSDEDAV
jgi:hypothetical protein